MGEISWRGPDVGRRVWGDSLSRLLWFDRVVSLVVFASGDCFILACDGPVVVVVDRGFGSIT